MPDELVADAAALAQMRARGGTWAAYRNEAWDSACAGHFQFLRIGPGCTCETPPARYPKDTKGGMGWRYCYYGTVDMETGKILKDGGKNA